MERFAFLVSGLESHTESEAWETFDIQLAMYFKWIRGRKYWRSVPKLIKTTDFDKEDQAWIVQARIISCDEVIPELDEAIVGRPYPSESISDAFGEVSGFGFCAPT